MAPLPPSPAVPDAVAAVAGRVDAKVAEVLDADAARWAALDPELAAPLRSLRELVMAGGKRIRPAFCYWAYVGVGGDPADGLVADAGAALELLHTFALVHDDVMDGSPVRHGIDAVHVEHGRRHSEAGWQGEEERFGAAVAILVGDIAFVYSDRLMTGAPRAARDVFDELRLEVNIGQYLDLVGTVQRRADPELAVRICRYKTGKYTVERPLHLGAALAAPERLAEVEGPLSAYGLPLGEAFQLTDDLLGAFGDPATTGKPVGEDLREGKPTLLYALAHRAARGADRRLLDRRFGAPDLTADEVAALREVIEATGARKEVTARVGRLVEESTAVAARLPLTAEARQALRTLAVFVAGRDH